MKTACWSTFIRSTVFAQSHEFRKGSMIKRENNNSWPWYKSSLCTKQMQICKQYKPLSMDVLNELDYALFCFSTETILAFWGKFIVFINKNRLSHRVYEIVLDT